MNERVELRPRQQQAVDSTDARIVVSAGPGSGKTRVLVERISRAVLAGRLTLDRVLAITFTINAAAEMKRRLAERLPRAAVESAAISTIHGFCAALLRQHPVEARVDPAFRVLEEVEAEVLKARAMDQLLDRFSRRDPAEYEEFTRSSSMPFGEILLDAYEQVISSGGNIDDPQALLPPDDGVARGQLIRLAEVLNEFHLDYGREKDRLSALDFDDLERRASQLLQDNDIARSVASQFDEVLVDEYQDTSAMQARIVERVIESGHARLFIVGDPKQSIYAFRNARPENFDQAIERAQSEIQLVEDFRSRQEVLNPINRYFGNIQGFGGRSGFAPLKAGRQFPPARRPAVTMSVANDRLEEARNIAQSIAALPTHLENFEWGQVAILFRAVADMGLYEDALAAAGIPYFSETGRGFYKRREIADIVSFLRVLDNDRDEIALAAVLRSPMFEVSDDALYLLAQQVAPFTEQRLCDILPNAGNIDALPPSDLFQVRRFLEIQERLEEIARYRPLDSLIMAIGGETAYDQYLLSRPAGDRALANLRKLAQIAHDLRASSIGAATVGEFARVIDRFREDEVREAEATTPESGNAVRLMTMHAAKGLEFRVVVLADLGRKGKAESSPFDYQPSAGLGCTYRLNDGTDDTARTPSLDQIRAAKKIRNEMEEERLLFVAMTRAEELLILSGAQTKQTNNRFKRIVKMNLPVYALPPVAATVAQASLPAEPSQGPRPVPLAPPSDQTDFAAAITDVVEYASCPRRYYLGRYLGFSNEAVIIEDESTPVVPDEMSASERGTAVHKRLAGELAEVPPEIEELARRFEESELGRRLLASESVERELPILAQLDGRFLHGALDLRCGDTIVDYKTGRRDDNRYRLQMLLYGLLTGAKELYLFYLDEVSDGTRASRVEASPASFEEARDVVRRFFAAQQTLEFPGFVEEHCVRCAFNGKQCREPQKRAALAQTTT